MPRTVVENHLRMPAPLPMFSQFLDMLSDCTQRQAAPKTHPAIRLGLAEAPRLSALMRLHKELG